MIGITLGDACGVGPEILVRHFANAPFDFPSVVYGDAAAVELACEKFAPDTPLHIIDNPAKTKPQALNVCDLGLLTREDITIGRINGKAGAAAVTYVEEATRAALTGEIKGFVTLPINKESCRATRPDFQGHTELIAGMCEVTDYTMMLAGPKMIVTHVSTHVSLREAIDRVKRDRVLTVTRLTAKYTQLLRGRAKIVVAGLNPHAGEHGAFGREDLEEIEPAVQTAQQEGLDVTGPVPPDTLFMKVLDGAYDAVVCMYHDQGHIPMKMHGFAEAVNITIGLPIIRTSVDHGTAFDIAWQGIAHTENFEVAIEMCRRLTNTR